MLTLLFWEALVGLLEVRIAAMVEDAADSITTRITDAIVSVFGPCGE